MEPENLYVKILRGELHAKSLPPLWPRRGTEPAALKEKADASGPAAARPSLRNSTA